MNCRDHCINWCNIVSSWSIAQGVDPTIGNIIGAAVAFGTIIVSFKIGG